MDFSINDAIAILNRAPDTLRSMLSGLRDEWLRANEGEETWSPFDIVGHLIYGEETDWIPRARLILRHGEGRPFDPFDRFAQFEMFANHTIDELLDLFTTRRRANLEELRAMQLTPEYLERTGTHPAFGPVTLRQLLSAWVAHDLSHIAQIARVMSKQYREEVGPWREYLPILDR